MRAPLWPPRGGPDAAPRGPGVRLGLWSFRTGFDFLRWGAYLGMAASPWRWSSSRATVAGRAALDARARGRARGTRGRRAVVLAPDGEPGAAHPRHLHRHRRSTRFRGGTPASGRRGEPGDLWGPGGRRRAGARLSRHPVARPAGHPAGAAFARARDAAREAGWAIVDADSGAGRVEATATTGWFGFKDDVVVRIRPEGQGSRVDVRSVSRVGKSDVGTNARRIRAYLDRLRPGEETAMRADELDGVLAFLRAAERLKTVNRSGGPRPARPRASPSTPGGSA